MIFANRREAGQKLASKLAAYERNKSAIVLGLARGGVVVAAALAKKLGLPLDVIVPRKIGAPGNPEFAIGAVTLSGPAYFDKNTINNYDISPRYIDAIIKQEKREAARRERIYRAGLPPLMLNDKIVILTDDGIATGATMQASILYVRIQEPKKIIVAVPVIAKDTAKTIGQQVDELNYLEAPEFFDAIGNFYQEFGQTTDEKVIELLRNPSSS